ncbi:MAG: phenylacetate--CoA ligase [Spirochaetales bacterium]|jgi:phenylacetate-CoA ligase|nr:phenylacetate--CoA ligase [Spirochaetales bacterium]
MIWNEEKECANPAGRKAQQSESLARLIKKIYEKVPFYRQKFDQAGVKPSDIQSIDDIVKLPFTTKDELRETYPYGLVACPREELTEIHISSGTTGIPVVGGYTEQDVKCWGEVMARSLVMAGAGPGDVIHNAYGYGMFTGGLGAHYGAMALGANVLPVSGGNTHRQVQLLKDFKATYLTCTPSYALHIAEYARDTKTDMSQLALKGGLFGAEPWTQEMRQELEQRLRIKAYDVYGLTEVIGPGVANECVHQNGLHVQEDYFYPEIINPDTGEVLPPGQKGELVLTTLLKEGTPLIRYRTRDITFIMSGACSCGRTTIRMHRLMGRTDDMLIIRGVNLFPSQIEEILIQLEETEPHYQIVVDRGQKYLDEIEVWVEVQERFFSDETKNMEKLRQKISSEMKSRLGVNALIKLVEPKTIARSEGKAKRVIDKRTLVG